MERHIFPRPWHVWIVKNDRQWCTGTHEFPIPIPCRMFYYILYRNTRVDAQSLPVPRQVCILFDKIEGYIGISRDIRPYEFIRLELGKTAFKKLGEFHLSKIPIQAQSPKIPRIIPIIDHLSCVLDIAAYIEPVPIIVNVFLYEIEWNQQVAAHIEPIPWQLRIAFHVGKRKGTII